MHNNNFFVKGITISIVIVAFAAAYYLVVFLPKKYESEQGLRLYEQTLKQGVDNQKKKDMENCVKELGEKLNDKDFIKSFSNLPGTLDNAEQIRDIYIKNCMSRKGYSDFE